ncbi:MAG: hypothetical protein K9H25_01655 [Rhodospirillum sp.]|nr:hypothetical protein [Rhodospirillum sp.]MCF8488152.1 hypothetical protein [Rhodospirillum sp.]MCF8502861.1 hypothetical protein [Rhodospirillum sp.]
MARACVNDRGLDWGRLAISTLMVGGSLIAPTGAARAETASIGGWFVSDEHRSDGTFSHCMMLTPYLNKERKVLLSVTLSRDKLAMLAVSDTDWTLEEGAKYSAKVAIDGGKPTAHTATNGGGVARVEVPEWSPFAAALREAEVLAVKSSAGVVSFRLYDMAEALRALESCAATGHPPTIKRIVRDDKGNVIREESIPPVKDPVPDIVIQKRK